MKVLRTILTLSIFLSACGKSHQEQAGSAITLEIAAANSFVLDQYPCELDTGEIGVFVCHIPPGNFNALHNICIERNGIQAHLNGHKKGDGIPDVLGPCSDAF